MGRLPIVRVGTLVEAGLLEIGDGYRMRNEELGLEGFPFVRGGDIGDGSIEHRTTDRIRPELHARIANKLSRAWDVAFITKGTVGRVGLMRPGQPPVVFSPQVAYWRSLDSRRLWPRFVYYWIKGPDFQARLDADKTHGAMVADYVSISQQHQFTLPLPKIADQQAIAAVLGALDDKIELNRQTCETLEQMAHALFKSWFIDFEPIRAEGRGPAPFGMDAAAGEGLPPVFDSVTGVPIGWTKVPLDSAAHFLNGLPLQKFAPVDEEPTLPVIKIAQLRSGSTNGADRCSYDVPSNYRISDGDLLFSWSGSLVVRIWSGGPGALNQHLFKVTSVHPLWFVWQWLLFHLRDFQRIASAKATTMGHIQRHHLSEASILLPPEPIMMRVQALGAPLVQRKIWAELQSNELSHLRDMLLPKLLSGELRIKDAERFVSDVT